MVNLSPPLIAKNPKTTIGREIKTTGYLIASKIYPITPIISPIQLPLIL